MLESLQFQFRDGMRMFAAFHEGSVVALMGFHTRHVTLAYLKRSNATLLKHTVYFNAVLTSPSLRGQGIATALKRYMLRVASSEGYRFAISATFALCPLC